MHNNNTLFLYKVCLQITHAIAMMCIFKKCNKIKSNKIWFKNNTFMNKFNKAKQILSLSNRQSGIADWQPELQQPSWSDGPHHGCSWAGQSSATAGLQSGLSAWSHPSGNADCHRQVPAALGPWSVWWVTCCGFAGEAGRKCLVCFTWLL